MSIATRPLGSTGLAHDLEDITRATEQTGVGGGPFDVVATVG
jgi:hypothetical protein